MVENLVIVIFNMSLKTRHTSQNLPKHIAIIMDGNGRWAKEKGFLRVFGHENGTKSVRTTVESCAELGIRKLNACMRFRLKTGIDQN